MFFQIINCSNGLEPIRCEILSKIPDYSLKSNNNDSISDFSILFNPHCFKQICNHIGWGNETGNNQIEQGGIILGKIYKDASSALIVGVAEYAVPAIGADASLKHFEISIEIWHEMLNFMDEKNLKLSDNEKINVIGWYHTHPKHLKVYMSEKDLETQKRFFFLDYHFSVIFNPQKRHWKAFQGKYGKDCTGLILINDFKCLK